MLDASNLGDANPKSARFFVGAVFAVAGYAAALIGSLAFFKIPLPLTFLMLLGGLLLATIVPGKLDRRLVFTQTSRALIATNMIGSLLIAATMLVLVNWNWKSWYFHPAGFQSAWFTLAGACFHSREILNQYRQKESETYSLVSEYYEDPVVNPYAPPLHSEIRISRAITPNGRTTN